MEQDDPYWRVKEIFADALDLPADQREAFVESACAGNAELREKVSLLLAVHAKSDAATSDGATTTHAPHTVDLAGTVIGPYTLIERLGEGGMGVVYKAQQDAPIRRLVALKLIKLGMDTGQVLARFEAERQTLASLNHPNIARVFDAGATETGRPYFVMELVEGQPITRFCDERRLDIRQRLALFQQACHAIAHAHQKAVIHRDIKPGNILVAMQDDAPTVKVIDFGVARALDRDGVAQTLFTEQGQLVGTPEYMSPEQADPGSDAVDTRTDIYSLGVVLYELLAGVLPFESKSLRAAALDRIRSIIRESDPPTPSRRLSSMDNDSAADVAERRRTDLSQLARALRSELEWIPLKAMRKEPGRRYASASELAGDVANYLDGEALIAAPESRAYRARKFVRRHKALVIGTSAVTLALIAGIAGTTIGLLGEARQRRVAQEQRDEADLQRDVAKQQSAVANAVSAFQADMLASADPNGVLGEKVTVVQAVLAAAVELDAGKLAESPLVEAGVRQVIGDTLASLGKNDEAIRNLRRAVDLRRASLGKDDLLLAFSLGSLGNTLSAAGRYADAEPALVESLAIRERVLRAPHRDIAKAKNNLGLFASMKGDYPRAEALLAEAIAMYRLTVDKNDIELASAMNNRASVLALQAHFADAAAQSREALAILRTLLPAGQINYANTCFNLASSLQETGELDEAESLGREALAIYRNLLPSNHPAISKGLSGVATTLYYRRQFADAEAMAKDALAAARLALPPKHPDFNSLLSIVTGTLTAQGRFADAEPYCRESLEIARASLPPNHPELAVAASNLAVVLRNQNKLDECEPLMREALAIHRATLPAGHPSIGNDLNNLARVLRAKNQFADAVPLLREAFDLFVKASGPESADVANVRLGLAMNLMMLRKFEEAELEFLESARVLEKVPGRFNAGYRQCAEGLVDLYKHWDERSPGQGYAAKAALWEDRRRAGGPATVPTTEPSTHPSTAPASQATATHQE
jgi:serine/threonine protein kinase